jgi:hypothetical protein
MVMIAATQNVARIVSVVMGIVMRLARCGDAGGA